MKEESKKVLEKELDHIHHGSSHGSSNHNVSSMSKPHNPDNLAPADQLFGLTHAPDALSPVERAEAERVHRENVEKREKERKEREKRERTVKIMKKMNRRLMAASDVEISDLVGDSHHEHSGAGDHHDNQIHNDHHHNINDHNHHHYAAEDFTFNEDFEDLERCEKLNKRFNKETLTAVSRKSTENMVGRRGEPLSKLKEPNGKDKKSLGNFMSLGAKNFMSTVKSAVSNNLSLKDKSASVTDSVTADQAGNCGSGDSNKPQNQEESLIKPEDLKAADTLLSAIEELTEVALVVSQKIQAKKAAGETADSSKGLVELENMKKELVKTLEEEFFKSKDLGGKLGASSDGGGSKESSSMGKYGINFLKNLSSAYSLNKH